ncbi:aldo/keto reductase, partial [Streptosporangium sp. NPDC003464]
MDVGERGALGLVVGPRVPAVDGEGAVGTGHGGSPRCRGDAPIVAPVPVTWRQVRAAGRVRAGRPGAGRRLGVGRQAGYGPQTPRASLRRLRTDYVDLYWVHMWDRDTPIEETMRAL